MLLNHLVERCEGFEYANYSGLLLVACLALRICLPFFAVYPPSVLEKMLSREKYNLVLELAFAVDVDEAVDMVAEVCRSSEAVVAECVVAATDDMVVTAETMVD